MRSNGFIVVSRWNNASSAIRPPFSPFFFCLIKMEVDRTGFDVLQSEKKRKSKEMEGNGRNEKKKETGNELIKIKQRERQVY